MEKLPAERDSQGEMRGCPPDWQFCWVRVGSAIEITHGGAMLQFTRDRNGRVVETGNRSYFQREPVSIPSHLLQKMKEEVEKILSAHTSEEVPLSASSKEAEVQKEESTSPKQLELNL